MLPRTLGTLAAACILPVLAATAHAEDASIAYSGYLELDGSKVTGPHDFNVHLYNDTAGSEIWSQRRDAVLVSAGLFGFDIGPIPAGHVARRPLWIKLSVKRSGDPDVPASWHALAGFQRLTPVLTAYNGVPPGTIVAFGGVNVPQGWLRCDGGGRKSADFPELFDAIGTRWGDGTDHCASGPCQFNLPNLRGRFLRGDFHTDRPDPDPSGHYQMATGGATSGLGAYQDDAYTSHDHGVGTYATSGAGGHSHIYKGFWTISDNGSGTTVKARDRLGGDPNDYGGEGVGDHTHPMTGRSESVGGNETRPDNALVAYIIKY